MNEDELVDELATTPGWTIEYIKETAMTLNTVKKSRRPFVKKVLDTAFDLLNEKQKSPHMTDILGQSRRLNKLGDNAELDFAADILSCETIEDAKLIANAVIEDWKNYMKSC